MLDTDDNFLITGRRAKQILRREIANYVEYNTIELNGIILKRVNTAVIDHKKTTYFKCKNMKTPYRVTGICNFSGRIAEFPEKLDIEIINDHSPTCSYLKKPGNFLGFTNYKNEPRKNNHKKIINKTNSQSKKKKRKNKDEDYSITCSESYMSLFKPTSVKEKSKCSKVISPRNGNQTQMASSKSINIPEFMITDPNLDVEIYIQLCTEDDIEKEKEMIRKYPDWLKNILDK